MNKYFFTLSLHFKKDINQKELENILGLKATHFTPLSESKTEEKFAHFYYQTDEYSHLYSDDEFERFLISLKDNLTYLPQLMAEFDGECYFSLVFTEVNVEPCISLSKEAISFLSYLGARFDVDFI